MPAPHIPFHVNVTVKPMTLKCRYALVLNIRYYYFSKPEEEREQRVVLQRKPMRY